MGEPWAEPPISQDVRSVVETSGPRFRQTVHCPLLIRKITEEACTDILDQRIQLDRVELRHSIGTADQHLVPIRRIRNTGDGNIAVTGEGAQLGTRGDIPQADRLILTPADHKPTIRGPGHTPHDIGMTDKFTDQVPTGDIPQANKIIAAGNEPARRAL
jgi:hypothetical protein